MLNLLPTLLIFTLWASTTLLSALPFVFYGAQGPLTQLLSIVFAPMIFIVVFPLVAGLQSRIGISGIKRGKFPREPLHPVYFMRRIYGICWTQLYYFKPIYTIVLAIPLFKKIVFRLFGYKTAYDITLYPDTWIRDLPMLKIESGAYLSNRATIGTNICLSDGTILVDSITLSKNTLIGHLTMLAPGVKVGELSEIAVGCAIGVRVTIKECSSIKPTCSINHGTKIGKNVDLGPHSFLGLKCEIGDGIKIPAGANIPAGSIIHEQSDMDNFYSSETQNLQYYVDSISDIVKKNLPYVHL